jgi:hypothetical protein
MGNKSLGRRGVKRWRKDRETDRQMDRKNCRYPWCKLRNARRGSVYRENCI